jgi:hypothetical protein
MEPSNLDKWRFSLYCAMYFLIVVNPVTTNILKINKLDKNRKLFVQFVLIVLLARISMGC